MRRPAPSLETSHPRAAILVIVLLAVLLVLGLTGSLFRLAVLQHGQSRRFELQAQADWLARSGADRAAMRLADDKAFPGDTWSVDLKDLGTVRVVTQVVTPVKNSSLRRIESRVRLAPGFLRTPVHGHATLAIATKSNSPQDTP